MKLTEVFSRHEPTLTPQDSAFVLKVIEGRRKPEQLSPELLRKIATSVANSSTSVESTLYAIERGKHPEFDSVDEWTVDWIVQQDPMYMKRFWLPRNTIRVQ